MSDLMRDEFEVWVKKRAISGPFGFHPQLLNRCKLDPDRYAVSWVDSAFEGWQASRECLVIELPKHRVSECGSPGMVPDDDGDFFYYDEVISSIHASGVKTK